MKRSTENRKHGLRRIAMTASAFVLSAVLSLETFASPILGFAAEKKEAEPVTIEAAASTGTGISGGFESAQSPKITKARRKLFKKAFKNFVGSDIIPVAYLASQVVAGTNHLYLCRIKAVVPDAKEYYCFVTIYENLKGKAKINEIVNTETETGINELMGGWFASSNVKVTKSIKKAFKKAMKGLVGVDYKPVAVLSEQVVAGMNYCILCESKGVYPGAQTGYSLVYLYKGLDGSAEITDIVELKTTEE